MKVCFNCGNSFNGKEVIDGVIRNLQNRIYCLQCSPFGSRLTRRLPNDCRPYKIATRKRDVLKGETVSCKRCGRIYVYDRSKGHHSDICNSCNANRKRREVKQKSIAYKGGKCVVCGYDRCGRALAFHHRDREHKEFTISKMMSISWASLCRELDKCDLVCTNCHMEIEEKIVLQKMRLSYSG